MYFPYLFNISTLMVLVSLGSFLTLRSQPEEHSAYQSLENITILVDLGGVLIETDKGKAAQAIGLHRICTHTLVSMLLGQNPGKQGKKDLFEFLASLDAKQTPNHSMRDPSGDKLPPIMCDWMKGTSNQEILDKINAKLATCQYPAYKRWLFEGMTRMMFTSTTLKNTQYILKPMFEFLKQCKDRGARLIVLSNYNHETARQLQDDLPELFAIFDDIVISGEIGYMKPEDDLYDYLEKVLNVDLARAIGLDDQKENIMKLEQRGAQGILISKKLRDLEKPFNKKLKNIARIAQNKSIAKAVAA